MLNTQRFGIHLGWSGGCLGIIFGASSKNFGNSKIENGSNCVHNTLNIRLQTKRIHIETIAKTVHFPIIVYFLTFPTTGCFSSIMPTRLRGNDRIVGPF